MSERRRRSDKTDVGRLLYEPLIRERVDENRRHVSRTRLLDQISALAHDPDHRVVLITGEPGAGKTGLAAALCRRHPGWLRYFVRVDSRSPLSPVDTRSLLLTVGHQLAAIRPGLVDRHDVTISVDQRAGDIGNDASMTGVRIGELKASPFRETAIAVAQTADYVDGTVIAVDVGSATLDAHMLDIDHLQALALAAPLAMLAENDPHARVVLLIDGIDEVRHRAGGSDSILTWLAACGTLPNNFTVVVTSRHDPELLERVHRTHGNALAELNLDAHKDETWRDIDEYAGRVVDEPETVALLARHAIAALAFRSRVVARADGNFQYVAAIDKAIAAVTTYPELAHILRDLDELPPTLGELYAFFLSVIKDSVGATSVTVGDQTYLPAWTALYTPLLGVLAVARAAMTPRQLGQYGQISARPEELTYAIGLIGQFLDAGPSGLSLYHATSPSTSPRSWPPTTRGAGIGGSRRPPATSSRPTGTAWTTTRDGISPFTPRPRASWTPS